jgi:MOSC domain-containing protein YiiM
MPRLERIWIKRARLGPMDPVDRARIVAGRGLVGNAHQGGRRQVTLLAREHWADITHHLPTPDPIVRRANLLLSDIELVGSRGNVLRIGSVRLQILGETRPCERMDAAVPGLRQALGVPWGGGAFAEVLNDGEVSVGEAASWESGPSVRPYK